MAKGRDCSILLIIILAAIMRLAYVFFYPQIPVICDPEQYDDIAMSLMQSRGFPISKIGNEYTGITRPPGYPLFLALIFNIFGHNYQSVRIIQALLDSLTCLIIFCLGRTVFNSKVGRIAAICYAFYTPPIIFTGLLYTETLFTLILSVSVFFMLLAFKRDNFSYWMLAGLFLGLAALISSRPVLMPFLVLGALLLSRRPLKESMKSSMIVLFFMIVSISPWTLRNYMATGKFVLLENYNQDGTALWLATNPYGIMTWGDDRVKKMVSDMPLNERAGYYQREAWRNLRRYPISYLKNSIKRFTTLWVSSHGGHISGLERSFISLWQDRDWRILYLKILLLIINVLFAVFGFTGLWLNRFNYRQGSFILMLPVFYFTILHTFYVSSARLQIPALPFLTIFAASALIRIFKLPHTTFVQRA